MRNKILNFDIPMAICDKFRDFTIERERIVIIRENVGGPIFAQFTTQLFEAFQNQAIYLLGCSYQLFGRDKATEVLALDNYIAVYGRFNVSLNQIIDTTFANQYSPQLIIPKERVFNLTAVPQMKTYEEVQAESEITGGAAGVYQFTEIAETVIHKMVLPAEKVWLTFTPMSFGANDEMEFIFNILAICGRLK